MITNYDFTLAGSCDLCREARLTTRVSISVCAGHPATLYEICRPCAQAVLSRFKKRRGVKRDK